VNMSPTVVRVWMPVFLGVAVCLFLSKISFVYWLLFALPLLPIVVFMVALAEVRDEGMQIQVKTVFKSMRIFKTDIVRTEESFLDGIGVLHLRWYVLPYGRIYFVRGWSTRAEEKQHSSAWNFSVSVLLAISGFVAARAGDVSGLRVEASHARILALACAGSLCVWSVAVRGKRRSFANCLLFAAAYIIGLARGW